MSGGKVILITGTRRGIGHHLADHYCKRGFQVIGCSRHPMEQRWPNYRHFCLDVGDEPKVRDMFGQIRKTHGRLDVLINNAGIHSASLGLMTPLDDIQKVFATNLFAAVLFCREAAKIMQENRFGRIVNVSSIAMKLNAAGTSIYTASKAALEQFTQVLAKELAPYGITVNVLALSYVENTGMAEGLSETARSEVLRNTAFNAGLEPDDISHTMDFLISEHSKMLTSHVLRLGGF